MVSSRLTNLHPYVPGEQPKDRIYIKLNANENPYPPSPKVIKAVRVAAKKHPEKLGLYPDPDSNELREAISEMLNKSGGVLCRANLEKGKKNGSGAIVTPSEFDKIPFVVTPDMIYAGNGSDEVLSFVFYAFFDSDRKLVLPEHTYSFYPVYGGFFYITFRLQKSRCIPTGRLIPKKCSKSQIRKILESFLQIPMLPHRSVLPVTKCER